MYWIFLLPCLLAVEASDKSEKCAQLINIANGQIAGSRHLGEHCLSRPRKFKSHENRVEELMLKEITQSYELLLMSHQFGTDVKDRPGFKKYFESLSDKAWENAIKMAKYVNRRGSGLTLIRDEGVQVPLTNPVYIGEELASLGAAMDLQQSVVHDLHVMHNKAREAEHSDPDLAKHAENMLKDQISDVRTLAGYITNLNSMYGQDQKGLALFHFDNMLADA